MGVVSEKNLDGVTFEKGDPAALFETARKIAHREGYGNALAEGPVAFAQKLGKKATDYLYHNQGMTMRTFEFRAAPGTALGEAISARGNSLRATTYHVVLWDHNLPCGALGQARPGRLRRHGPPGEGGKPRVERKEMFGTEKAIMATEYEGKPAALIYEMNGAAIADSLGYCTTMIRPGRFGAPGSQFGDTSYQFAAERFTAATGIPTDEAALFQAAERVCNIERAIVVRDGRTRATDVLPEFFFEEPVPDGPQQGKRLDRKLFEKMKDEYYTLRGWDKETGLQREATLKKLGMADVAKALKAAGKLAPAGKEG